MDFLWHFCEPCMKRDWAIGVGLMVVHGLYDTRVQDQFRMFF